MQEILVEDWNKVLEDKMDIQTFTSEHWEKFRNVYKKVMGVYDDGDLYIQVFTCLTKMKRSDVVPVFQSDGRMLAYFKKYLITTLLINLKKNPEIESLNQLEEDLNFVPEEGVDNIELLDDKMHFDIILKKLNGKISENQLKAIILLCVKQLTPNETCKKLGIYRWTLEDRINRVKPVLREILESLK